MRYVLVLLAALWAAPTLAQDDDGAGFLERQIQNALSGAGRDVTVRGFRGALSSEATLERLTIADAEGVWLILEEARLDWDRSALLRGRLEVEALAAARLEVLRPPAGEPREVTPEATPIAVPTLPALPVSVRIGRFAIDEIALGAPVIGEPLALRAEGAASLADGQGTARLSVVRIDGPEGRFEIDGTLVGETGILTLDLLAEEGAEGLIARRLGIPGAPALALSVEGEGPLDAFVARVALASDGQDRFAGTVETREGRLLADLSGDLRPIVPAEYHPFLGPEAAIAFDGARGADDSLVLNLFDLSADALSLEGTGALSPGGWPERFDVTGRIAPPVG
ncbi:MAG: translocation/assembly module TamB domain-containing protein, partial [Shimia sp.]